MPSTDNDLETLRNDATSRAWLKLTSTQQAIWLDAQVSDAQCFELCGCTGVQSAVDDGLFVESIRMLISRHEALRLRVDDRFPRQWLDTSDEVPALLRKDFAAGSPEDVLSTLVEASSRTPFLLGDYPLFRVELQRTEAGKCFVLWRFHQLIVDASSVLALQEMWWHAYQNLVSGRSLPAVQELSLGDVLKSDREYLESVAIDEDLAYWFTRFDPLPTRLITDTSLAHESSTGSFSITWSLAAASILGLKSLERKLGISMLRCLYALFSLVLARRYGTWDIVLGVESQRGLADASEHVGSMGRLTPVRCVYKPTRSIVACIELFDRQLSEDLEHGRVPLDILARSLDLIDHGRTGMFEVAVSDRPLARSWRDLSVAELPSERSLVTASLAAASSAPIFLNVSEAGVDQDEIHLQLSIHKSFLAADEITVLKSLLEDAIAQSVTDPEMRVELLSTVSKSERPLLLKGGATVSFPAGTLDVLFTEQVLRTPSSVAVVGTEGRSLTYAELGERSTKLSRQLAGCGIKEGDVVGVRMVRSTETVIALLGILKAGAVYLPLDPTYPAERLDFIVADAGAKLVLYDLDSLSDEAAAAPLSGAARLAYIIYTSGTTGRPKGVAVAHSAPVNLAFARRANHDPIGPGDRVLAAISVGFDVSIGQLLLPLLSGAAIVIAPDLRSTTPWAFWSLLADQHVTHINSVPSFLDTILDAAPDDGELSLRMLMLGGEALTGSLVRRINEALPSVQVVNMYGPTEACIDATYYLAGVKDYAVPVLPIGRPLANYTAYILDQSLQLKGIGVSGELYVGGAGVAQGYVNDPRLTAERFIPDPFSNLPGARLYRTGDRASWNAELQIEFLGRVDQQIKIRGFRVEPAEVATVLLEHPKIAQAVVVPHPGPSGFRFTAYLVAWTQDTPDTSLIDSLRTHAATLLPDYMVPASFVLLNALPLTTNGKLDLKALPVPENAPPKFIAPRTQTESKVAEAFAETLGLNHCGASCHFFELGGHSLLGTELLAGIETRLKVRIPLRAIFDHPTVRDLSSFLDKQAASK